VLRRALDALLGERYLEDPRALVTLLPIPSRMLPGRLRLALHHWLARPAKIDLPGPQWPVDHTATHLRRLFEHDMPTGFRFALSHDLDSPASFPHALRVARMQSELGHRASYFIVGRDLRRARRLIGALRELGHEVGLHGLLHDFRLGRLRGGALDRRVDRLIHLARTHRIDGFRSPALLSSARLRQRLAPAFRYDSSLPTSDRQSLLGPVRGCATTEPYPLDGLLQIPISAPLEDRLMLMGYSPTDIFELYRELWTRAREREELIVIASHLEPHLGGSDAMQTELARFLEQTAGTPSVTLGELGA